LGLSLYLSGGGDSSEVERKEKLGLGKIKDGNVEKLSRGLWESSSTKS